MKDIHAAFFVYLTGVVSALSSLSTTNTAKAGRMIMIAASTKLRPLSPIVRAFCPINGVKNSTKTSDFRVYQEYELRPADIVPVLVDAEGPNKPWPHPKIQINTKRDLIYLSSSR